MDSSSGRANYFTSTQSTYEKTYVKDYTETEAEEYLKVQELSFNHKIFCL